MTNPAGLSALMKGDVENFLVASTPGGIQAQEKAGQTALVNSTNMPKTLRPSREAYEKMGFVFGADVDDIFVQAKLPAGWTRQATDHDMWSRIVDDQGRTRVNVFYKAAFYDRNAHADLEPRYRVRTLYADKDGADVPVIVADGGAEIHRAGIAKDRDYETINKLEREARVWLTARHPNHAEPTAYW